MTPEEANRLLAHAAAFDNRQPSRVAAQAWAAALHDVPLDDDTLAAVARFYGTPPPRPGEKLWMQPHDVRTHRRLLRAERLEGFEYVPQPDDDDPARYLANLRAQRAAVAAGRRPAAPARPALPAAPDRDVAELVGGSIGRTVPNHDEPEPPKPGSPLSVPCPTCTARTGYHCRMRLGIRRTVHPTRARVAAGLPSYNPADQAEAERRRAASAAALANLSPAERAQLTAHIHAQQQEAS